jgi:hypothetical protein
MACCAANDCALYATFCARWVSAEDERQRNNNANGRLHSESPGRVSRSNVRYPQKFNREPTEGHITRQSIELGHDNVSLGAACQKLVQP